MAPRGRTLTAGHGAAAGLTGQENTAGRARVRSSVQIPATQRFSPGESKGLTSHHFAS